MKSDRRPSSVGATRPRICVVETRAGVAAYDRLDECDVDVVAILPRLSELEVAAPAAFDVVVLGCDETLLRSPGFERRVARIAQHTPILGVAARPSFDLAAHAARLAFQGFVAREIEPAAFERSITAVLKGELAFPRTAMSAIIMLIRRAYGRLPRFENEQLTPRQRQIVDLIVRGANDREIADVLHISPSTVQKHVQNALRRTRTRTRGQLAAALGQPS